jgi:uncharacterized protein YfiM (DUF2279 family)
MYATPADSLNKKRFWATNMGVASLWSGSIFALSKVWYSKEQQTGFHFFDDASNWMQMDKAGHVYATYQFSEKASNLYQWTGLSRKKSVVLGAGIAWGYQLSLEFLDGRSEAWGFSWSDIGANTVGSALYVLQDLKWKEQVFRLKFSYSPSPYAAYRPAVLGSSFSERLLKDYNAQTYWLSFSPQNWFPASKIPPYLALSIGYSADAKLIGDEDVFISSDGLTRFEAKREFILSLDLNVQKLPIKKKWVKKLLSPFDAIKIPFPALVVRGNKVYASPLYF